MRVNWHNGGQTDVVGLGTGDCCLEDSKDLAIRLRLSLYLYCLKILG